VGHDLSRADYEFRKPTIDSTQPTRYHLGVLSPIRVLSRIFFVLPILLGASYCSGQNVKETSVPLGDVLSQALDKSSLTGTNAVPFHLKVHLFESTNPPSDYRAEIEWYWVSAQQWRRSIDSPTFKQTLIVNGDKVSEQNTGDYYPLWLKSFVTGILDPVPNADEWRKLDAKITQKTYPNGLQTEACARATFKIGSDTVKNDAFASICFDREGRLALIHSPGYGLQFHEYQRFTKKLTIARYYQNSPEPGTKIVANVVFLEEFKKPDPSLFSNAQATPPERRLESVEVSQGTIEEAAQGQPPITWPTVHSGNTTGVLSMYISVDREGRVREAYPLNSDNAGLQDAARDQLLRWTLKPITVGGKSVQAQAALSFHFDTTLAPNSQQPKTDASTATASPDAVASPGGAHPTGFVQGFLVSKTIPNYPADARKKHIQGKVVLEIIIDASGVPRDIHMVSSPDQALTDSAIEAVTQWRYEPSRLNGIPVSLKSTVEVNFQNP
jgi:TonB family protein